MAALDALEQAVHTTGSARGPRRRRRARPGRRRSAAAARRLESAWLALDAGARREQEHWAGEIERVRAWRRPTWPLWLITAVVVGAATYLGLVLGGYLPVPPPLEGLTAFWWAAAVNVIGVGVDLVDLERVARLLSHKGEQAMQQFFTDDERAYLATRPDPTGHAAARIAAKEAVYKALQSLPGRARPSAGGRSRSPGTATAGRRSGSTAWPPAWPRSTAGCGPDLASPTRRRPRARSHGGDR